MKKIKTRDIPSVAFMAAVICVCSWISVPSAVPFTLQTFGVFFALLSLGGRKGTAAIVLYIFLGMVGIPVFSGFQGGIGHLAGATGGYIAGFILIGAVYLAGEAHAGRKGKILLLAGGLLLCYLAGTLWFMAVTSGGKSFLSVAAVCVLPYLLPDAAKLLLADILAEKIRKIRKGRIE